VIVKMTPLYCKTTKLLGSTINNKQKHISFDYQSETICSKVTDDTSFFRSLLKMLYIQWYKAYQDQFI